MTIPTGAAGTSATLKIMVKVAREARRDPRIRYLAAGLIQDVGAKDFAAEVNTIFEYVRQNIRYTLDINDVETIQLPVNTLEFGYGDCDDMCTLLAAMLESIGHPSRFAALSFDRKDEYSHVIVQTLIGTVWVALDPTEPNPMGWQPPDIKYWMIRSI